MKKKNMCSVQDKQLHDVYRKEALSNELVHSAKTLSSLFVTRQTKIWLSMDHCTWQTKNGHMDHCTWQRNNPMDHFARGRQNTSNNIFLRLQIAENQPALWVSSHVRPTISEILRQFALFTSFMLNKSRVR